MSKNITKNIHVYPINYKFNANLELVDIPNIKINFMPLDKGIHKYIHTTSDISAEDVFLFNASIINNEIKQFIESMHHKLNIVILKDVDLDDKIFQNKKLRIIEIPINLINTTLYDKNSCHKIEKIYRIAYFHKPIGDDVPTKLDAILYPNSDLPIVIFDNSKLKHPLSVGFTNEEHKKKILFESEYYLHGNDNYYVYEANLSCCKCLNFDSKVSIPDQIKSWKADPEHLNMMNNIVDYKDFLASII